MDHTNNPAHPATAFRISRSLHMAAMSLRASNVITTAARLHRAAKSGKKPINAPNQAQKKSIKNEMPIAAQSFSSGSQRCRRKTSIPGPTLPTANRTIRINRLMSFPLSRR